ncbi:YggS family pyridoxal phosphate-dependent enzyme [Collinsella sp. zg1085]|uniref:YggS family pyridoxal phosphate-dependent enzyme n=1 Tax=Collinsella sp. zg1085 TaxID=2844380 RepID=UPI001C0C2060|nr:YggS family pyridoxal phosphate-dependent enzyme [Collinsella sp. zg1085]QWT18049.1 YggS family pyridoxal phosphate-dependent enzyme [Collinsella sp. zg1085]
MDSHYLERVIERRVELLQRMREAARDAHRSVTDVQLVAVSKTVSTSELLAAVAAGYRHFAENRPQMLNEKLTNLAAYPELPQLRFDLIGNLQTNKINAVLSKVQLIHSISSVHLAEAVSKRAQKHAHMSSPQDILLEVNISGEATKSGFEPHELRASMDTLCTLPGIRMRGLMTMAPRGSASAAAKTFEGLRLLRDELVVAYPHLDLYELSCGMSEDFEVAIREGSTMIRLGRVVFDPAFALK